MAAPLEVAYSCGNAQCPTRPYVKILQPRHHFQRLGTRSLKDRILRRILALTDRRTASGRFEQLMQPHFDALWRAAQRIAASDSDAEDLLQEVCLKAYLKLDELEEIEYQRAWLLRVLYNLFIDGQRKDRRSPLALSQAPAGEEPVEFPADRQWQPEEQVDRIMHVDAILRAMKLLDLEQCSLLALHDIEGYGLEELGSLTGLPVGTLKSQLHRTRVKLGRLLRPEPDRELKLSLVGGPS